MDQPRKFASYTDTYDSDYDSESEEEEREEVREPLTEAQKRDLLRQQTLFSSCRSGEDMLRAIELLKKDDLRTVTVVGNLENDEEMRNCSHFVFPAAMRSGGSDDDVKNELLRAQDDIENMVSEGFSFEQLHGEGEPFPEMGDRMMMEMDVPEIDALTEEDVVVTKWVNATTCQVDDEVYYELVDRRYLATTEMGQRECVAVEVVIFDDDFVYPHKWKVSGGHLSYPEDPLSAACRITKSAYGSPVKGMKRAGVIREMLGRRKTVTYVYFAPIDMNSELELQRVSLINRKNHQVFLLDQCVSLLDLRQQWERMQGVMYKVEGVWRPKNAFSQQMKKGGGTARFLMRKKGRYFDIHMKILVWLKDGCTHGYKTDRCGCTIRMVGQRQFLGFSFQSSLIKGWVKCFINQVNDNYWMDDEKVRGKGQRKLRVKMRQHLRDRFRIEWSLGGVPGRTGWIGIDVLGGHELPRYARIFNSKKRLEIIVDPVYSPGGVVTLQTFHCEK